MHEYNKKLEVIDVKMKLFIDESGHTGDVHIGKDEDFDFDGQPCFVLAGIGIRYENQSEIEALVHDLKLKHRIQSPELKSSRLYNTKPNFIVELMNILKLKQYPIFVEINDKKYLLCMQITNLICRSMLEIESPDESTLTDIQRVADYLYDVLPTSAFILFSNACRERSQSSFDDFISSLESVLLLRTDDMGEMLYWFLRQAVDVHSASGHEMNDKKSLMESLLPEPDISTNGRTLSALPNIPSLSNILARAEQYRRDNDIAETVFIHDEQAHLFNILHENMMWLKDHDYSKFSSNNHLNGFVHFHLDAFSLVEGNSKDELGIQIADVIAGTVYRVWSEFIRNGFSFPSKYESVFLELVTSYEDNHQSVGVNFVVPQKHFDACMHMLSKHKHLS